MNSANVTEWDDVATALAEDAVDVSWSAGTPEQPAVPDRAAAGAHPRCGLLVIDEAHCIAAPGATTSADYRRIGDVLAALSPEPPSWPPPRPPTSG